MEAQFRSTPLAHEHSRYGSGSICTFLRAVLCIAVCGAIASPKEAYSEPDNYRRYNTPRFTLYVGAQENPKKLNPHFEITLAEESLDVLESTYHELSRIFQRTPSERVVLRFLSPEDFRDATGAPEWTSAMYFRGEISVPLTSSVHSDMDDIKRAIRHEYVHAVIAEFSDRGCPAWLDEGIAQLLEGGMNPLLGPALRKWIKHNNAMELRSLHNGFTTLEEDIVPAAYAQSLFAARSLVNSHGFPAIRQYLNSLQSGEPEDKAFAQAFSQSKHSFEQKLTREIRRWASSSQPHP